MSRARPPSALGCAPASRLVPRPQEPWTLCSAHRNLLTLTQVGAACLTLARSQRRLARCESVGLGSIVARLLGAGDPGGLTVRSKRMSKTAYIRLGGTLALILLMAAGCGGASKTPVVASLGPAAGTTPSSGKPSRSRWNRERQRTCARVRILHALPRGSQLPRPRRAGRPRNKAVARVPARAGDLPQATTGRQIHRDTSDGATTHRCARSGEVHSRTRRTELPRSNIPEHRRPALPGHTRTRPGVAGVQARRCRLRPTSTGGAAPRGLSMAVVSR